MAQNDDQNANPSSGFSPEDFNRGWTRAMGVSLVQATKDLVELEMPVDERHLQPFGLVHGGVFAGLVETAASIGASLHVEPGNVAVGAENQTSFIRPVRDGVVLTRARPIHVGRRSQLWQVDVVDQSERLVATGRLRVFVISANEGAAPRE